ncbi:capsule biosynthesis protein [Phaeovulum sp.]|uniref:capsule biosynthesis protein n=1 Tax=Phaeovulum sp. TaxID=2934796 RepID=UPI0027302633|nr:capsular biosynthesis protein [Phaeovulum sp.]MDP1667525.1 capsular biosynthesis protein [Phaeovulum sp.]MDZ4120042.1 capsular biosynthesis protein [Phaeovulum sp.]
MRILFLQGHPSFFARDLGRALMARGHHVRRINFCVGDWLFWRGPECSFFRGSLTRWEVEVEALMRREAITHLVYFADRHPYHLAAQRAARRLGVISVSHEFGYLRPDWILVEEGGQSAFSHFPDQLAVILAAATALPPPDMTRLYNHPFWQEALQEVAYNLGNFLLWPLHPRFVADRAHVPLLEYLAYLPRQWRGRRAAAPARALVAARLADDAPFFLLALQMQGDYQIRHNSRYRDMRDFVREVLGSFARHAPGTARLVVKQHPMDNGLTNWARVVRAEAAAAGIGARVDFLDGGDLAALLGRAAGCVVVNSTVGLHALQAACPVKCMGIASFDIAGLTHQGPLESFWSAPEQPDREGVTALVRLMAAAVHVRGEFFSPQGRAAAVNGFVRLLEAGLARPFGAFTPVPPRLKRAQAEGISTEPWD